VLAERVCAGPALPHAVCTPNELGAGISLVLQAEVQELETLHD